MSSGRSVGSPCKRLNSPATRITGGAPTFKWRSEAPAETVRCSSSSIEMSMKPRSLPGLHRSSIGASREVVLRLEAGGGAEADFSE